MADSAFLFAERSPVMLGHRVDGVRSQMLRVLCCGHLIDCCGSGFQRVQISAAARQTSQNHPGLPFRPPVRTLILS